MSQVDSSLAALRLMRASLDYAIVTLENQKKAAEREEMDRASRGAELVHELMVREKAKEAGVESRVEEMVRGKARPYEENVKGNQVQFLVAFPRGRAPRWTRENPVKRCYSCVAIVRCDSQLMKCPNCGKALQNQTTKV